MVAWVGLQCVIVVFSYHTHLFYGIFKFVSISFYDNYISLSKSIDPYVIPHSIFYGLLLMNTFYYAEKL